MDITDNRLPAQPQNRHWPYRATLLWLGYLALALALTWPTAAQLTTHLPGDGGDDPAIAWNLWWVKFALLNRGQNPFQSDFMFYPVGINLAFYTLTVLNAVTALPLTLNFGVVTASNLHMLFTFVAGGYGVFLLARGVLASAMPQPARNRKLIWMAAAIAGGFYAFAGSKLFYVALGQFNIASSHWVPFAVLYILRTRQRPHRLKNGVMAGLFLTLQAWAESTYASFLLVFIGVYWLYHLAVAGLAGDRPGRWQAFAGQVKAAGVMGLVFAAGLSPILAQMLPDMRAEGDFLVEGGGFADVFSADLLGFVIPTMHHPLLGRLITHTGITAFNKGQHIYLGVVLLGLLVVAAARGFRRPHIRFWLLAAAVFALLCLGPEITVNGRATGLTGPFTLLQTLPFFKGNRYPSRYSVMLLLSLSVLSGYGWACLGQSLQTRRVANTLRYGLLFLIPALFLFEHLSLPLPQSDMRIPQPYRLIAADPANITVLDIPFAWRNGFRITGPLTTQFMFGQFYQTGHQKRLLQGNTSRNPAFKFQYFTTAPVINSLLALETGHTLPPEQWAADRAIAADVLRFFNIKYIVARPYSYPKFNGADTVTVTGQNAIPYIETVLPVQNIYNAAGIKIYRVTPDTAAGIQAPLRVGVDSPLAPLYFAEGWGRLIPGRPVAAQRRQVRLLLPLTAGAQRITLHLRLPDGYPDRDQTVTLKVNGWQSPAQPVGPEWQAVRFNLPSGAASPGLNSVYLNFGQVFTAPAPQWPVADITVTSAGEETGDFGHIFVNGRDVSPNQRGYNVALVEPGGRLLAAASFDTHLNPEASAKMARFIAAAPADALVAVAAADEASANLGPDAVQALQAISVAADMRGCFRCSHALIYNPAAGTTLESFDPLYPATVTTGLGLTEPSLAALLQAILVEPVGE